MKKSGFVLMVLLAAVAVSLVSREPRKDARLKGSFRRPQQNGWIFVRLEGAPSQIGFQHGYLLAPEIREAQKIIALNLEHDTKKDWQFFRTAAEQVLWPRIERQYRDELNGIVDGLKERGVKLDVWDLVALNAWLELGSYYTGWYDKQHKTTDAAKASAPEHCSAFVATGSYTRDGRPVIGHNAWTGYMEGSRWNIIFDIVPAQGHRFFMDGFPGLIHSADDFGVNTAGMMITETTISQFSGFDPTGVAEFARARKAMQYSESIDDFARIMTEGNNGGYANNWLIANLKTGEIGSLELGLKNVNLRRTHDGYFGGANFPVDAKLASEETGFLVNDMSLSPNARRVRWDQLMSENKGRIGVEEGKRFLSDHYDTYAKKVEPSERTLCGHIDLSPRGSKPWQPEFGIAGAVQAKVMDARMGENLSMWASMGHSCGIHFKASAHLKKHPQFAWQKEFLKDLDSRPWTEFRAVR